MVKTNPMVWLSAFAAYIIFMNPGSLFGAIIGGLVLVIALFNCGRDNYSGKPIKTIFRVLRYVLAGLILLSEAALIHYGKFSSIYPTIVKIGFAAYLIGFKPSDTTIWKKIMKVAGFFFLLGGINNMQNYYNGYNLLVTPKETLITCIVTVVIGLVLLYFGGLRIEEDPRSVVDKWNGVKNI